jgi:hypothetical protein
MTMTAVLSTMLLVMVGMHFRSFRPGGHVLAPVLAPIGLTWLVSEDCITAVIGQRFDTRCW